jgi:hypothetical protein
MGGRNVIQTPPDLSSLRHYANTYESCCNVLVQGRATDTLIRFVLL